MNLTIINGPNLNLLGKREPEIYGTDSFETFLTLLKSRYSKISIDYFQSNHEGAIIDKIQSANCNGIIYNGAGFTHTSVAIADAIAAITIPVIEVHISNIYARESFRHHSYSASKCVGIISGLGLEGYALAIEYFLKNH